MARLARTASLRLILAAALLLLAVPFTLGSAGPGANAATAKSSAKTVNGTWHPFRPLGHFDSENYYWTLGDEDQSKTPSVTVDQTTNLHDQFVKVSWKNFTPSSDNGSYSDNEEGTFGTPTRFEGETPISGYYTVQVFQCRGLHPTINPALNEQTEFKNKAECYHADVFGALDGPSGPNNSIPAVTDKDGTGQVSLHIENRTTNSLLRCGPTQPCSVVVVPNQGGISGKHDDGTDDLSQCGDHDQDFFHGPDFNQTQQNADLEFSHHAMSACSWSKRIVVPLTFAPLDNSCPDTSSSFNASGSPPLRRGLGQLLTGWCRGSRPVSFDYDFSSTESAARSRFLTSASTGLSSDTDVALTSEPADPSLVGKRPFAYAPIANDAVSIPYEIDNARTGKPITDLRLSARLVAKLLTQSYAPLAWNCKQQKLQTPNPVWCAKDIQNNPQTIFDDKEFQALNFRGDHPDRGSFPSRNGSVGSQQDFGSFFPTVAAGDSDLTYLLTRWIASDSAANSFLRGAKDGFNNDDGGMRINPNYLVKGGSLYPTTSFTALDPGYTAPNIRYGGAPDPPRDFRTYEGLQGAWNPVTDLSAVIANLARNRSSASLLRGICPTVPLAPDCNANGGDKTLDVSFGRTSPEPFGSRDLTAVTDNTDAQAYKLPTAQLLTGRGDYVAPSAGSLFSATRALHTNADKVTQSVDFDALGDNAYPLLMPVYAMVPTCGVSEVKAAGIRAMLDHVLGSQNYGEASGTLAPGLLKLTAKQLADTRKAAKLVSSKRCPAAAGAGGGSGSNGSKSDDNDNGGAGAGGSGGAGAAPTANPNSPAAASNTPTSGATTSGPGAKATNVGYRSDDDGGALALLPILLLLGGLILVGGPLAWWGAGTGPGQVAVARARHLAREGATDLRNLLPGRWRS